MSRRAQQRKDAGSFQQNFLAAAMRRFVRLAHYSALNGFRLGEMIMRYKSAFAVPSGFAVATRTATKGKTMAAQDVAPMPTTLTRAAAGRLRQASAGAAPVRAA